MNALSNLGLLRRFVGMLTDSRSFLSFPRHEYFRRTLCDLLGDDIHTGRLPRDLPLIGKMVEEISFGNARDYFGLDLHESFKNLKDTTSSVTKQGVRPGVFRTLEVDASPSARERTA